ncbi:UDP-N-acetylmuramoyl-tripeptide--D-alanyl-D-alanine ligase [Bdellovibrionota bacterium FG-1]
MIIEPLEGQPTLTPQFVYEKLGFFGMAQRAVHPAATPFTRVVTDSRKIEPGCLFVALQGEKYDGHEFIASALEKGAQGVLCKKGFAVPPKKHVSVFAVDDTLAAYRKLAAAWRREFAIPVIAVAGSVGKTTTKEILSAILHGRWPEVLKTEGSQNGYVGIPMTLLEIRPHHGAAVIEVGIDEIGAMENHMALVGANHAILTAIAPEHLEKLIDLPTVAREEGLALTSVAANSGFVAISLDDPWIRPHFATLRQGRKIGYSMLADACSVMPPETLGGILSPDGQELQVIGLDQHAHSFALPLPGRHNAANLLGAIAMAFGLGFAPAEITQGLKTFTGAAGRSELRKLPAGNPVVCDYYNASPASMEAGLQLLCDIAQAQHAPTRWACLGDMLELGPREDQFHRDLAASLLHLKIENILLYGPRMTALFNELQNNDFAGFLGHFETHDELARTLISKLQPTDAVLIKGSRGMKMEEVWNRLNA